MSVRTIEGLYSPLFQPSLKAEKVVSSIRTIIMHIKHIVHSIQICLGAKVRTSRCEESVGMFSAV